MDVISYFPFWQCLSHNDPWCSLLCFVVCTCMYITSMEAVQFCYFSILMFSFFFVCVHTDHHCCCIKTALRYTHTYMHTAHSHSKRWIRATQYTHIIYIHTHTHTWSCGTYVHGFGTILNKTLGRAYKPVFIVMNCFTRIYMCPNAHNSWYACVPHVKICTTLTSKMVHVFVALITFYRTAGSKLKLNLGFIHSSRLVTRIPILDYFWHVMCILHDAAAPYKQALRLHSYLATKICFAT